jgi:hypothetical protein
MRSAAILLRDFPRPSLLLRSGPLSSFPILMSITASLHGWMDAIQRGQAQGGPQLTAHDPIPTLDELIELQHAHAALTGERLTLAWLMTTLMPAEKALMRGPVTETAPASARPQGWRQAWNQARIRWEQWTLAAPAPLSRLDWQLARLRWRQRTRALGINGGVTLMGAFLLDGFLGKTHPVWHMISSVMGLVGLGTLSLGTLASVMASSYAPVRHISSLTEAVWQRSPLAQRYLRLRAEQSPLPLLVRDQRHLQRLCRADGLLRPDSDLTTAFPAPLASRDTP